MFRLFVGAFTLAAMLFLLGSDGSAQDQKKAKNNQMVTGTIKAVDLDKNVLVILQKVKNDKVDRELSITEDVEFEVAGKQATGRKGMDLLKDRVGANVKIKCDKDVNVLKVTVK